MVCYGALNNHIQKGTENHGNTTNTSAIRGQANPVNKHAKTHKCNTQMWPQTTAKSHKTNHSNTHNSAILHPLCPPRSQPKKTNNKTPKTSKQQAHNIAKKKNNKNARTVLSLAPAKTKRKTQGKRQTTGINILCTKTQAD